MNSSNRPLLALPLLALTLATGCQQPDLRFEDNLDLAYDLVAVFVPDKLESDNLHSPYLAGAVFEIYIWDDNDVTNFKNWEVRSSDDTVLQIIDTDRKQLDWDEEDDDEKHYVLIAEVQAVGEGLAALKVYDSTGDFVDSAEIEVGVPNEVELRAAGPMFIDRDGITPQLGPNPKLIGDGTATFEVEYYRDGERLWGHGDVAAVSASPLIIDTWGRDTFFDESRDWLSISTDSVDPETVETATVDVLINGNVAESVDFTVVGDAAVASLELHGRDETGAAAGEYLPVLAQALDEEGEVIWGVAFDWDLDGVSEPGEGDLFRYLFAPGEWSTLGASYAGLRVEAEIQGNEGYVDSSNDVSCFCSADVDKPGRGIGFGLLSLLALGLVRRRRG